MPKIVSKYNSDIKKILNDVKYLKFCFSIFTLMNQNNYKITLILNNLRYSNFYLKQDVPNSSLIDYQLNKLLNMQIIVLGIFTIKSHVQVEVMWYRTLNT